MLGIFPDVRQRHLVGAERAFDLQAIDHIRSGPSLGRAQDDHRPLRPPDRPCTPTGPLLDRADLRVARGERGREARVHVHRIVALEEVGLVAVTGHQTDDLLVGAPTQHRGAGDLVAVQMQDRQHRAVSRGVQKMNPLPRARQWSRLGLAVADHGDHEEVGIVEGGAEGVNEHVAELAALVDRSRRRDAHVAGHAARRRELPEEPMHAGAVPGDARVHLRVRAFEVHVRQDRRSAMARAGEVDHVGVALDDEPIQVGVDEAEPGRRPPVPEEARLDVLGSERLAQEGIVLQIDLADGQVIGRTPVRVEISKVHHRLVLPGLIAGDAAASSAGSS